MAREPCARSLKQDLGWNAIAFVDRGRRPVACDELCVVTGRYCGNQGVVGSAIHYLVLGQANYERALAGRAKPQEGF